MRSSEQRIIEEECDSDDNDEANEEIQEEKSSNIRHSVERLDSQVSTLHQDVATLSLEVRNAIHALQEMTYTTLTKQVDHNIPTRSIPNLQNDFGIQEYLIRSSSQPVDIWQRSNSQTKSSSDIVIR